MPASGHTGDVLGRATLVLVAAAGAVVLAGCGSSGGYGKTTATTTNGSTTTSRVSVPAARTPAEVHMAAVIHSWSARLDKNDYNGIAKLFAVPAIVIQGPYAYRLKTLKQVALWHSFLPCGSTVVGIVFHGAFATAVFKLANRTGHKCDAPGALAAARFEFAKGKIVSWTQVAVPKSVKPQTPVA
jgi:hypothetical protein